MTEFLKRRCRSKRGLITYLIVFLWIFLGVLGLYHNTNLIDLSTYFISLTGFVTVYIFGESVRNSKKSSIFLSGPTSKREALTYFIIAIWFIIGGLTICNKGDLLGIGTYFAALTPFIGSYIIGETYKQEKDHTIDHDQIKQINS
jgi:hypothetical protein